MAHNWNNFQVRDSREQNVYTSIMRGSNIVERLITDPLPFLNSPKLLTSINSWNFAIIDGVWGRLGKQGEVSNWRKEEWRKGIGKCVSEWEMLGVA